MLFSWYWVPLVCILLTYLCIYGKPRLGDGADEQNAEKRTKIRSEFDWRAYLELYPDLANHFASRDEAFFHYLKFGRKEGRRFPKIFPNQPSFGIAHKKLLAYIKSAEDSQIPVQDRTFIIYFIGPLELKYSLEAAVNNARIFSNALKRDSHKESTNFYWFNIIGGVDNLLRSNYALDAHNVADVDWTLTPSDIFCHFRTLGLLKHILENKFGSILFINQFVRGPFNYYDKGAWIQEYRSLLHQKNGNIGLVGPTLSCEYSPHIQNYLFMIRSELIPAILAEYTTFRKFDDPKALARRYDVGLTEVVQRNGFNIASRMYFQRSGRKKAVFDGSCLPKPNNSISTTSTSTSTTSVSLDPTRWCDVKVEEVLFYRWDGDILRSGFLCESSRRYMSSLVLALKEKEPSAELIHPETLRGGSLLHLYKEFDTEMWHESQRELLNANKSSAMAVVDARKLSDKVCFMVRTCQMHEVKADRALVDTTTDHGIDGIVTCKKRFFSPLLFLLLLLLFFSVCFSYSLYLFRYLIV
jgi:hypothetical protein